MSQQLRWSASLIKRLSVRLIFKPDIYPPKSIVVWKLRVQPLALMIAKQVSPPLLERQGFYPR
ncbi:hypothetical protein SAMN04490186_3227 [Pseudomonas grimontii]|jgi:hypothetical protein|uniref:Uncharacterized protein n=1 Tax=Pseudomonas grimontii TaxID=129847 RepID=A0ABY0TS80_9PSED|nr:hypothetical protein SAMN04490186_3227 [Pseudomonas grimontii]